MMRNQDQIDELESLQAIYDGSEEVVLELPEDNADISEIPLQARLHPKAESIETTLLVKIWLPYLYLAQDDSTEKTAPRFELACPSLSRGQLSQLCRRLDQLVLEHVDEPILFTWLEWLRMDAWTFVLDMHDDPSAWDSRVVVDPDLEKVLDVIKQKVINASPPPPAVLCDNCLIPLDEATTGCITICHTFCSACIFAAVQVHTACGVEPRCPLPQCRELMPEAFKDTVDCPKPWMLIARNVLRTPFQDVIVFCPSCEDRGVDTPTIISSSSIDHAADPSKDRGVSNCRCSHCSLSFCGVCRSPCHPGEACFADESRVVRMSKRRPALPPALQDLAVQIATGVQKSERDKAREFRECTKSLDFLGMRKLFLELHEGAIWKGLESIFGGRIQIQDAPIDVSVQKRFMESVHAMPLVEMRPAWHGTNIGNHSAIFKTGLLVPGHGNNLRIVHGAAHGTGVYTANIDAPWLSKGFCSGPAILVCAVLQSPSVRHVGDAMIIPQCEHVVPLFEGTAQVYSSIQASLQNPRPLANTVANPLASKVSANAHQPDPSKVEQAKTDKSSKFKARLERKSKRH